MFIEVTNDQLTQYLWKAHSKLAELTYLSPSIMGTDYSVHAKCNSQQSFVKAAYVLHWSPVWYLSRYYFRWVPLTALVILLQVQYLESLQAQQIRDNQNASCADRFVWINFMCHDNSALLHEATRWTCFELEETKGAKGHSNYNPYGPIVRCGLLCWFDKFLWKWSIFHILGLN